MLSLKANYRAPNFIGRFGIAWIGHRNLVCRRDLPKQRLNLSPLVAFRESKRIDDACSGIMLRRKLDVWNAGKQEIAPLYECCQMGLLWVGADSLKQTLHYPKIVQLNGHARRAIGHR